MPLFESISFCNPKIQYQSCSRQTTEQVNRALLQTNYGKALQVFEIKGGVNNHNYLVYLKKGGRIFGQECIEYPDEGLQNRVKDLMEYLNKNNVPVSNFKQVKTINKNVWKFGPVIGGQHCSGKLSDLLPLTEAVANLHNALKKYKGKPPLDKPIFKPLNPQSLLKNINILKEKLGDKDERVQALVASEKFIQNVINSVKTYSKLKAPMQIMHNNIHPHNTLITYDKDDKPVVVILNYQHTGKASYFEGIAFFFYHALRLAIYELRAEKKYSSLYQSLQKGKLPEENHEGFSNIINSLTKAYKKIHPVKLNLTLMEQDLTKRTLQQLAYLVNETLKKFDGKKTLLDHGKQEMVKICERLQEISLLFSLMQKAQKTNN